MAISTPMLLFCTLALAFFTAVLLRQLLNIGMLKLNPTDGLRLLLNWVKNAASWLSL
jgi:hypothetical protein